MICPKIFSVLNVKLIFFDIFSLHLFILKPDLLSVVTTHIVYVVLKNTRGSRDVK